MNLCFWYDYHDDQEVGYLGPIWAPKAAFDDLSDLSDSGPFSDFGQLSARSYKSTTVGLELSAVCR